MPRFALIVLLLAAVSSPSAALRIPRHLRWSGTIATDGLTGTFRVRARFASGSEAGGTGEYVGQFRCHGRACPLRHGWFTATGGAGMFTLDTVVRGMAFWRNRPFLSCYMSLPDPGPASYVIDGPFQCDIAGSVPLVAGTLHLTVVEPR